MRVLLTRFHLNGQTIGFHPLESPLANVSITGSRSERVKIHLYWDKVRGNVPQKKLLKRCEN